MHVGDDQAQVEEVIALEQTQLGNIGKACLLEEHEDVGIVDMPLRVQVTVAHLDRTIEMEIIHREKLYPWPDGMEIVSLGLKEQVQARSVVLAVIGNLAHVVAISFGVYATHSVLWM